MWGCVLVFDVKVDAGTNKLAKEVCNIIQFEFSEVISKVIFSVLAKPALTRYPHLSLG